MIKVILINPPQKYFKQSKDFDVYFPLGLLSIGAAVKDICLLKIYDCLVTDFEIRESRDFILYGTPFEKIEIAIKDYRPDIVGISIPFSAQSDNAVIISKICKKVCPKATVVFGGPDASVRYKFLLENKYCDFCVVGEGEETFFEFIKKFHSKNSLKEIEGLAYRERGQTYYRPRRFIENLDALPFPAYDLVDLRSYLKNRYLYLYRSQIHKNSISVITSRGCPYNCVFCSIKLHMGQEYRPHSPDYVFRHLKFLKEEYGISNFHFEDDNISFDKSRFEQILNRIIGNGLRINWDTPNGIRADSISPDLLKKIKKSGCKRLTIGIESGNQRVLNTIIKKSTFLDRVFELVRCCRKLKIRLSAFYVIGFPGETLRNMRETIDMALKLLKSYNVMPYLLVATPLYGTELHCECIKRGLINEDLTNEDLSTATQFCGNPLISTKDFSKDDIKDLMRDYRLRLKKELIMYSIKHPFYVLMRIKDKPELLRRCLFFR